MDEVMIFSCVLDMCNLNTYNISKEIYANWSLSIRRDISCHQSLRSLYAAALVCSFGNGVNLK